MARHFGIACFMSLLICIFLVNPGMAAGPATMQPEPAPAGGALVMRPDAATAGHVPAVFPHDTHTRAVVDCAVCHQPVSAKVPAGADGAYPFTVKGRVPVVRGPADNEMHDACLSCHATRKVGPQAGQCATCHAPFPAAPVVRPRFDRNAHAIHTASPFVRPAAATDSASSAASPGVSTAMQGENCAVCHHPNAAGVVEPTSCRTCHGADSAAGPNPAYRAVAHATCVACHQRGVQAAQPAGPVTCAGCHDAASWARQQKIAPPARLSAGQPLTVFMQGQGMPGVPFNHALHEKQLPSCSVCHHQALAACGDCHISGTAANRAPVTKTPVPGTPVPGTPVPGTQSTPATTTPETGGNVSLHQAMHTPTSTVSCVGCHAQRQLRYPECAGCHGQMGPVARVTDNCALCHRAAPAPDTAGQPAASQSGQNPPETVRIGGLSQQFEAVDFPHGAVLRALQQGIRGTSPGLMAAHADAATCAACHHRAPLSDAGQPPACGSCHRPAAPGVASPTWRAPALQQAYHQQCMGCHDRMGVKPVSTDCAGCHRARTAP